MNYYLVYSYSTSNYEMLTGEAIPEGDLEVLYEFDQEELGIAQKVLATLSASNKSKLETIA